MPVSRVTRARNGAASISYVRGGRRNARRAKGHNGAERRNEYFTGINMLPDGVMPFERQMQPFWNKARAGHTTQVDRFVISFSPRELDSRNPADVAKGHMIACEIARELFPGHQAAVATQIDGVGRKVHAHILVNDVGVIDYRGLKKHQYYHPWFSKRMDEICSRYIELDVAAPAAEREPHAVRGKRIGNERIREKICAK